MNSEACCTCATLLSSIPPTYNEKTEKPASHERRLECCHRAICARCTTDNPRFASYCPFCQVSIKPTSLPQGLRDPPTYSPEVSAHSALWDPLSTEDRPPPYTVRGAAQPLSEKVGKNSQDVLHFVDPLNDSVNTLSIRYGIPAVALRRTNDLFSDHLLSARRTVLIPGEYYKGGVSLSPRPVGGEEEEARKGKVRKWMVRCKVAEYDVAVLYLKQSEYNLEEAVEAYRSDERWEKEHPLGKKGKEKLGSKNGRFTTGGGLSRQLS